MVVCNRFLKTKPARARGYRSRFISDMIISDSGDEDESQFTPNDADQEYAIEFLEDSDEEG